MNKQKAIQFLNEGRLEEAYKAFQRLRYKYPEDWIIYDGLAYLERNLKNNLDEARNLIEKAKVCGCPISRYHRVCADILWSKGLLEEATLEFEQAVNADRSVDNLTAFANSLMKTDCERAAPIWQKIIEKNPSNTNAYLGMAWIARKQNNWSLALEMATKAKEFQPEDPNVLFAIGQAYQGLGQYEYALNHYLEANKRGFAEKFIFLGNVANCYLELHKYAKALEHAYEAVKLNPQDHQANKLLNKCKEYLIWLCGEQQYSEAHPMMVMALEIWPDDSRLLAYMASLEIAFKRNYELGEAYIEKAFEHNNTNLDLLYEIKGALWFDYLEDREEGIACLEKAICLNRSCMNLIALASRIIDIDIGRAESLFQEAFRVEPENIDVTYGLARIALKREEWSKGFELATKCYKSKPSDPDINVLLAYAHFKLKRFDEALKFYLSAAELSFSDKVYLYNSIAECYQKLGDVGKSQKYAEKVLKIDPNNIEARKLISGIS